MDKLGMNLIFKPFPRTHQSEIAAGQPEYNPVLDETSGYYHCGREVMNKDLCGGRITTAFCSPRASSTNNRQIWISCPSCRVHQTPKEPESYLTKGTHLLEKENRWIGYSGLLYCKGKDCSINEGKNCQECFDIQSGKEKTVEEEEEKLEPSTKRRRLV